MRESMAKFDLWMQKVADKDLKNDLILISNDKAEIENRFYKDLEFGTGGMRGILGGGTNCMNIYTVMRATQGLADYMKSISAKSIAIGYDSRINSKIFSECAAKVMAENGFTVYLTEEIVPTPFISFLVRHYKCDMGIMITASHNPANYNGYKVSGSDGCQATDEVSNLITDFISKAEMFGQKVEDTKEYKTIIKVPEAAFNLYIDKVLEQSLNKAENIVVAYTPLNGAGHKLVPKIFSKIGLNDKDIIIVKEQGYPDGNFTTCPYPNPEKPEALKLGLEYAKKLNADILIATDPDADRVGTAVLHEGDYKLISGNEMGALLTNYILASKKQLGTLPENPVIIKTIVTTNLINKIAKDFNATVIDVLTGFKYIGEQITILEKSGEVDRFVFGFEESYGYLCGAHVRDKDAVVTSMLVAQMVSCYKKQNKTLIDVLNDLYKKYGVFKHKLSSIEFSGAKGSLKIKELMQKLRDNGITEIAGIKVLEKVDFLADTKFNLPKSNVLIYNLENCAQFIVRPSGTEPLIKFYLTANCDETFKKMEEFIKRFFV